MIKCGTDKKRSSIHVTENDQKHSVVWKIFMSVTLESAVFVGKNDSDNWHSNKNTKDLTMKQMFDISAKLVCEQDEIYGVETVDSEDYSWMYLSSIGDEQVISLQRTKVYVFSDSVLCLGKIHENSQSNAAWEKRLEWFKTSQECRIFDRIDGEPMEFEWNIFQGFTTLQLSQEVKDLLLRVNETPEDFYTKDYLHVDVLTTSHVDQETLKKNASQKLDSFLYTQEDLEQDNGHFSVLVLRESGILSVQIVHKVNGAEWQRR